MNHAGSINKTDGGWYQLTYNIDGDNTWWLVPYDNEDEIAEEEPFNTTEDTEILKYVLQLHNLKERTR